MTDLTEQLNGEAERIRRSGILGDARLRRLFDYLATQSLQGQIPKEIAIAIDVFGRGADFDVSQDALVRVYIHKLRRVLADYYVKNAGGTVLLQIPRGEYRLAVIPRQAGATALQPEPPHPATPRSWLPLVAALCAGVLLGGLVIWWQTPRPVAGQLRTNPVWSWLQKDDRPTLIVIGDYYLVGETDESMEVKRLIREYTVNSAGDLERFTREHPGVADRYVDVGLRYIPTGVAFAMRDVMPVLAADGRRIGMTMMSDVTPNTFKTANIVYIGYLSGMGIMRDLIFSGSRFSIGDSFDDIVDTASKHHYISQTASQNMGEPKNSGAESPYRDYGLFSVFRGPGGNTIVVISGTRDEGVRQTAEAFTNPARLRELNRRGEVTPPFEALLEVTALDGVNLTGRTLFLSKRNPAPQKSP